MQLAHARMEAIDKAYAGFDSRPDDAQLQFCKYRAHLDERLTHRVDLSSAAIDGDAATGGSVNLAHDRILLEIERVN